MPRYKLLPDIAIADVAFEAYGKDLEELFVNAAFATEEIMVDTKTVKPKVENRITLVKENLEDLLYDFISELIFLKDAKQLLFSFIKVKIEKNDAYTLNATLKGETVDPGRHELRDDVKAVTLHMFNIKKKQEGWLCRIVLDI